MQSSAAEVTMMESQNRKRAPAWTEREVRDLIAVWGEESVLSELRSSFRNAKTFVKISQGMKNRGHNRDPKQCRVKLKELRQAYQKTREANGRSGSEPQTCRFYDELHAIWGGSATTTPAMLFDSFNGDGGNTEAENLVFVRTVATISKILVFVKLFSEFRSGTTETIGHFFEEQDL
ncbi:hypothetical protein UY3_05258 [Chelonia mydas]|uniref:Myb/SANT-like DNA-binding domain-containing protein n=1 Tax=Chelonia mydas TaxID=8469 RepID=M7BK16_CHEMY|nr:hypothetical protein UY3_05258 [Chelonia mydas]